MDALVDDVGAARDDVEVVVFDRDRRAVDFDVGVFVRFVPQQQFAFRLAFRVLFGGAPAFGSALPAAGAAFGLALRSRLPFGVPFGVFRGVVAGGAFVGEARRREHGETQDCEDREREQAVAAHAYLRGWAAA